MEKSSLSSVEKLADTIEKDLIADVVWLIHSYSCLSLTLST